MIRKEDYCEEAQRDIKNWKRLYSKARYQVKKLEIKNYNLEQKLIEIKK